MMTSLLLLGYYSLFRSFKSQRWLWLFSGSMGYAVYTYNVAKLLVPLLVTAGLLIYRKYLRQIPMRVLLLNFVFFSLWLFPLFYDSLWGEGQKRFNSLSIFNNSEITADINYHRGQIDDWDLSWQKLFHNKAVEWVRAGIKNYLSAFDPSFLFFDGQADIPRHGVSGWGLLYVWMAPFLILGLIKLWNDRIKFFNQLVFAWLILSPVPSALTVDGAHHATRLFAMLIPLIVITAWGIVYSYDILRIKFKSLISGFLIIILLTNLLFYLQNYFWHYSQTRFRSWGYGMKQAVEFAKSVEDQYDQIIITKNYIHLPMLYYLFYNQYDPELVQSLFFTAKLYGKAPPTARIGKYSFLSISRGDSTRPPNSLYVAGVPGDQTEGWQEIGRVESPDLNDSQAVLLFLSSK